MTMPHKANRIDLAALADGNGLAINAFNCREPKQKIAKMCGNNSRFMADPDYPRAIVRDNHDRTRFIERLRSPLRLVSGSGV